MSVWVIIVSVLLPAGAALAVALTLPLPSFLEKVVAGLVSGLFGVKIPGANLSIFGGVTVFTFALMLYEIAMLNQRFLTKPETFTTDCGVHRFRAGKWRAERNTWICFATFAIYYLLYHLNTMKRQLRAARMAAPSATSPTSETSAAKGTSGSKPAAPLPRREAAVSKKD